MIFNKKLWVIKNIEEVCESIFAGGDVPKSRYSKTKNEIFNIPIYSNGEKDEGLYGFTDIKKVAKPSLTISARGTIGYSVLREKDFYPIVRLVVLIPRTDIVNLYFLKLSIGNIDFISSGTSIPQLTVPMVKRYSILLPPLEEQKQIVELFQSIQTAIEQVEEQGKRLKELRRSLCNGLLLKEPVFGNLLNKDNCSTVNFSYFTESIEMHDKNKKDVHQVVGLENIEPEDFTIKTWGNIEDGTTFTKRFQKGDVLFGKRRAYLKKVAVADFDGICSSDILVLRAKQDKMIPELLPFYVSAEPFIQYAVSTSAGSLSPRTKWKDLGELEVSLPKIELQKKILEVLQNVETTRNQLVLQKSSLKKLKQQLLNEIFG